LTWAFRIRRAACNPLRLPIGSEPWGMAQQAEFDRMPEPGVLRRVVDAGQCVVVFGRAVLYRFDVADIGMRTWRSWR